MELHINDIVNIIKINITIIHANISQLPYDKQSIIYTPVNIKGVAATTVDNAYNIPMYPLVAIITVHITISIYINNIPNTCACADTLNIFLYYEIIFIYYQ